MVVSFPGAPIMGLPAHPHNAQRETIINNKNPIFLDTIFLTSSFMG
jgi:hypothetical protein